MQPSRTNESVFGSVVRSTKKPRTAAKGGYLFRGLELKTVPDVRRTFILCPELAGEDLYQFPLLCWEEAQVGAFNLEVNNELDDGTLIYHATPRSYLLLEPFRPVTVTEAVESVRCIKSVDVGLRVGPDEPFWMAKGKLIHTLFDYLLQAEGEDDAAGSEAFDEAFRHGLVRFREVLPGSRISTTEQELESEARAHFCNLDAWLQSVRPQFHSFEVEADRVSTKWGLRGRADAVLSGEQGPIVVELKSGKPVLDDHLRQLFAYCLLFAGGEEGHFPEGRVIYSATGRQEALPTSCPEAKRAIVAGRNRVVALKRAHTWSGGGAPNWCDGDAVCANKPCFARRHCYRLFGSDSGKPPALREKEREYYEGWFRALSLDLWSVEGELARVLDPGTLPKRVDEGVTLPVHKVYLESFDALPSTTEDVSDALGNGRGDLDSAGSGNRPRKRALVRLELSTDEHSADFGAGEEVFLHRGDPSSEHACRGRVTRSDESGLYVDIRARFRNESRVCRDFGALDEPGWYLDRIPFSRGRDVTRKALLQFLWSADKSIVRAIARGDSQSLAERDSLALTARAEELTETVGPAGRDAGRHHNAQAAGLRASQAHLREGELGSEAGPPPPMPQDAPEDLCFSEGLAGELNEEQEAAIRSAMECSTYHLIHGPPGTGKTRVLARLITLCLDRGERVLVTCPTNVALDALLVAVMNLGVKDFMRVAQRSHVSGTFWEAVRRAGSPRILLGDLCTLDMDFRSFRNLAHAKSLVGATAYQCAAHPFFLRQKFDRVIVDEAGQLDEPSTLAPLSLARKFVLGGDHLQLPPVVQARQGKSPTGNEYCLEHSLFERLFLTSPESTISRLRMQYRMNQEVQDIPSRLFYEGLLFPSPEARRRRLSISPGVSGDGTVNRIIDPERPVVFVNVQGPDSGRARPEEAEAACRIVESLIASGVPSQEIGVITPYRAQQALIRNRLLRSGSGFPLLTVDTVDKFQGGEREVVILSLCRSDEVTSFLADRKRLNVSLSRARSKLILLGHGAVLEEHPLFASILQGLERITMFAVS